MINNDEEEQGYLNSNKVMLQAIEIMRANEQKGLAIIWCEDFIKAFCSKPEQEEKSSRRHRQYGERREKKR